MWWTQLDQDIWEKSGRPVASDLEEFTDLDNEDLIHCASLYHGGRLQRLAPTAKARAAQQKRGWFSLWRRGHGEWIDLLTGLTLGASGQDVDQVALGRVLPQDEAWEINFLSRERLSMAEAEPLLRRLCWAYAGPQWLVGEGGVELLREWFRRRELCLGPLEDFEVQLRPRRRGPALRKFLECLDGPPQTGDTLIFTVQCLAQEGLEDHPLIRLAEKVGEVDAYWRGNSRTHVSSRVDEDLLMRLDGPNQFTATLRFPGSLTFQSLNKALCCLYGGPMEQEYFEFNLSLDRLVSPDENCAWDRSFLRISEKQRVYKHLTPGVFFHWHDLRLHVLSRTGEPGPSPWFLPGPSAANQRLRRAFHSRLGKLVLETQPLLPTPSGQPPSRLPGLSQRSLEKLKTKEAMVVCMIEAGQPLTLQEVANCLQLEGFPLAKGLESLKKAWRRDSILREDSRGRVHVVAGAVLMDNWLMQRLGELYGGEEALTQKLQALFGLNARPVPARTVMVSHADEFCLWWDWPNGTPQRGTLEKMLARLQPDDLVVTELQGLGAACPVLEIDAGLEDLEAHYLYGCLHGYVLTSTGRCPVDWRNQAQPDLWEKIYRARKCPRVALHVRGSEPRVLLDPWMTRDGTNPFILMIRSQFGWEGISFDDILDVETVGP